ncbi:HsdM family class I SAM-dependent methyltransferase [Sphingobium lactosutens]|uniref:site-specific DNA-methyltransferase (adenine-specific) n=1 Tax=Sphingobium lactosutens DS20 TaxID=1331060 RepID=T0IXR1_9SPHN|nr:N-6 DNA methylase [Sphingobium lactosutens]EQB16665.1 hypothetical protein RLDS_07570 [Sphingobium lactosutens DS20]
MTSGTAASAGFADRLEQLLRAVGLRGDPDFLENADELGAIQVAQPVRSAFERMGLVGAFCPMSSLGSGSVRRVPVLYVAAAFSGNADAVHRAVWSQSVAPLLLIATENGFEIRNGFDYRKRTLWPWSELDVGLPAALASLTAAALRSSASWRDFHVPTRVDERLGRAVRALSDATVRRDRRLRDRRDLVNALVGRFLYLYVLADRGVIDQAWIDHLTVDGRPACPNVVLDERVEDGRPPPARWPAIQTWRLFDAIDEQLNGSIFPIGTTDRKRVGPETLHYIRRVLRADDAQGDQIQYGFLDVDYATIRTETISALYECFFELENGEGKKEDGAFYTPPFLVDYVVDEMDHLHPFNANSLVVDPACGSGAFLVAAFRRIVEQQRSDGHVLSAQLLHETLARCVAGFEIKQQAVNVARFSLYLTMLDYLPRFTLRDLPPTADGQRLFPKLVSRVRTQDAFNVLPWDLRRKATHVLANPPWTKVPEPSKADTYRKRIATPKNGSLVSPKDGMAEVFYWRALRDLCAPDGYVAMVLPTKSFIAPSATAFPAALSEASRILGITNLAHFRERLFANAREAATVVFATPHAPEPLDWTWRYSPKPSSQPVGRDGVPWAIVVDRGQVERFRQADLVLPGHEWFRDLMLQPLDRQLASVLSSPRNGSARSLGAFMSAASIDVRRGGSPKETGLPADMLLNTKSNHYRLRLGDLPGTEPNYVLPPELLTQVPVSFRTAFEGPMLLMSRAQSDFLPVDGPAAYSSSLLGIHFTSGILSRQDRIAALREIGAFPRTSVGRYLLALFGRLWVFDQRRFEAKDLRSLPFPYHDMQDLLTNPVTGFDDKAFTSFCRIRFGQSALFEAAVAEHHDLREGYQDGRRPADGSNPTDDDGRDAYVTVLREQIATLLPEEISVEFGDADAGSLAYRITIGGGAAPPAPRHRQQIGEEAALRLVRGSTSTIIDIIKPDVRSAWTVERAYADALAAVREIMAA